MGTPVKSAAPIIEGLTDEEVADAFALRLLDPDGPNVGRRVWAALEQIPVLKARLAALEADARRLDGLQEMIRACPHSVITFNDDEDVEDDHGMVPVGFSIRIDGCEPLETVADNLRSVIDAALSQEPAEGG